MPEAGPQGRGPLSEHNPPDAPEVKKAVAEGDDPLLPGANADAVAGPPPMKRRKKEKTPEQIAAAEAAKAEKKRAQDEEKAKKKAEKEQEKAARKVAAEQEKAESARLKKFDKAVGDRIKDLVQARACGLTLTMTDAEFNYVFCNYKHQWCSKKITTEKTYLDGTVKTDVQHVGGALYLTGSQAAGVFGQTKTKGGSYSGFYGATTWYITSMTVTKPAPQQVKIAWKLSSEANF